MPWGQIYFNNLNHIIDTALITFPCGTIVMIIQRYNYHYNIETPVGFLVKIHRHNALRSDIIKDNYVYLYICTLFLL